jgi:hypothetical protein
MSKRIVRNTVCLLVSASLLAFALVPPGVRHAHDVVDGALSKCDHGAPSAVPEVHHRRHQALSTHPHAHLGHVASSDSRQNVSRLSGGTWHLHFAVLGFYFALPDTNLPNDGEETAGGELVFLHVARNSMPVPADQAASAVSLLDAIGHARQRDAVAPVARAIPSPPVTSIPLCDSALLLRTGVRLA